MSDGSHTYAWDSANKAITVDTVGATYDALGRMVEQNRSGTYTQFAYGPSGAKLAILSGQTLQKGLLPLPGGGIAVYNSSGLLYYGHPDHLGSIRLASTPSQTILFDLAFAPFGETYASSGTIDPAFTGQRQDTVAGLYDFPERQYSTQGRWPAPDPAGLGSMHLSDPQTLNRYAYVRNNPLVLIDPQGLDEADAVGGDGWPWDGGWDWGWDDGGGGGGGDPTSGGDQGNAGGDCGENDPLCLGTGLTIPTNPMGTSPQPGVGDEFSNIVDAAIYASIYAYWQSVADPNGGEWGGEIYQNPDGTYSFDAGRASLPGDPDRVASDPSAIPDGTDFVAGYHTHGDLPLLDWQDFSPQDMGLATKQFLQYPGFIGEFMSNGLGDVKFWSPLYSWGDSVNICTNCVGPPP